LPTIRSRCQLVRFQPLPAELVAELLATNALVADPQLAQRVSLYSEGSLQRALELADPALWEFRGRLYARLAAPLLESVALAKEVLVHVEEAGREASLRRRRLRQVLAMAADFYRSLLRCLAGLPLGDDKDLGRAIQQVMAAGQADPDTVAASLERTLEAAEQVDRNANQATLIEAWLDDLAGLARRLVLARRGAIR